VPLRIQKNNLFIIIQAQALYYFITGIWPLVHIESFMAVTGPKTDIWLVKMVGLLTVAISVNLFYLCRNGQAVLLAVTSAASYMIIDLYYSLNGTISFVYLIDAALEFILIILLVFFKSRPADRR
jgi:hypothetical protein